MTPAELPFGPDLGLVPGERFPELWAALERLVARDRRLGPERVLAEFLGEAADPRALRVTGLHHSAAYLGDYAHEDEVDAWQAFLEARRAAGELRALERGPSYLAPKHYGTPGWWFSARRADGGLTEMFACRRFGPWARLDAQARCGLMSHRALSVATPGDVRAALDALLRHEGTELIAFVAGDELGHTYGHVRHGARRAVLEIVAEAPRGG
jgi:hypothetical protein